MKKNYINAELDIIEFNAAEVIVTSPVGGFEAEEDNFGVPNPADISL